MAATTPTTRLERADLEIQTHAKMKSKHAHAVFKKEVVESMKANNFATEHKHHIEGTIPFFDNCGVFACRSHPEITSVEGQNGIMGSF